MAQHQEPEQKAHKGRLNDSSKKGASQPGLQPEFSTKTAAERHLTSTGSPAILQRKALEAQESHAPVAPEAESKQSTGLEQGPQFSTQVPAMRHFARAGVHMPAIQAKTESSESEAPALGKSTPLKPEVPKHQAPATPPIPKIEKAAPKTPPALKPISAAPAIQAKLEVSQPDDAFEREADQVAEQVMRFQAPLVNPSPPPISPSTGQPDIQREFCPDCGSPIEDDECSSCGSIQRKAEGRDGLLLRKAENGKLQTSPEFGQQLAGTRGQGKPLPPESRSFLEPRIGADLGSLRIHTSPQADKLARGISAKAFTHGQDIYFKQGQFQPDTDPGKRLLAHEVAHTLQQGGTLRRAEDPRAPKLINKLKREDGSISIIIAVPQETTLDELIRHSLILGLDMTPEEVEIKLSMEKAGFLDGIPEPTPFENDMSLYVLRLLPSLAGIVVHEKSFFNLESTEKYQKFHAYVLENEKKETTYNNYWDSQPYHSLFATFQFGESKKNYVEQNASPSVPEAMGSKVLKNLYDKFSLKEYGTGPLAWRENTYATGDTVNPDYMNERDAIIEAIIWDRLRAVRGVHATSIPNENTNIDREIGTLSDILTSMMGRYELDDFETPNNGENKYWAWDNPSNFDRNLLRSWHYLKQAILPYEGELYAGRAVPLDAFKEEFIGMANRIYRFGKSLNRGAEALSFSPINYKAWGTSDVNEIRNLLNSTEPLDKTENQLLLLHFYRMSFALFENLGRNMNFDAGVHSFSEVFNRYYEQSEEEKQYESKGARLQYMGTFGRALSDFYRRHPNAVKVNAIFYSEDAIDKFRITDPEKATDHGMAIPLYLFYEHIPGSENRVVWYLTELSDPLKEKTNSEIGYLDQDPPSQLFSELNTRLRFPEGALYYRLPGDGAYRILRTDGKMAWYEWVQWIATAVLIGVAIAATMGAATVPVLAITLTATAGMVVAEVGQMIHESQVGVLDTETIIVHIASLASSLASMAGGSARLILGKGAQKILTRGAGFARYCLLTETVADTVGLVFFTKDAYNSLRAIADQAAVDGDYWALARSFGYFAAMGSLQVIGIKSNMADVSEMAVGNNAQNASKRPSKLPNNGEGIFFDLNGSPEKVDWQIKPAAPEHVKPKPRKRTSISSEAPFKPEPKAKELITTDVTTITADIDHKLPIGRNSVIKSNAAQDQILHPDPSLKPVSDQHFGTMPQEWADALDNMHGYRDLLSKYSDYLQDNPVVMEDLLVIGKINDETLQALLRDDNLRSMLAANPNALLACKRCASPCFPTDLTEGQITRIQAIIDASPNSKLETIRSLNEYIYVNRGRLETALDELEAGKAELPTLGPGLDFEIPENYLSSRKELEAIFEQSQLSPSLFQDILKRAARGEMTAEQIVNDFPAAVAHLDAMEDGLGHPKLKELLNDLTSEDPDVFNSAVKRMEDYAQEYRKKLDPQDPANTSPPNTSRSNVPDAPPTPSPRTTSNPYAGLKNENVRTLFSLMEEFLEGYTGSSKDLPNQFKAWIAEKKSKNLSNLCEGRSDTDNVLRTVLNDVNMRGMADEDIKLILDYRRQFPQSKLTNLEIRNNHRQGRSWNSSGESVDVEYTRPRPVLDHGTHPQLTPEFDLTHSIDDELRSMVAERKRLREKAAAIREEIKQQELNGHTVEPSKRAELNKTIKEMGDQSEQIAERRLDLIMESNGYQKVFPLEGAKSSGAGKVDRVYAKVSEDGSLHVVEAKGGYNNAEGSLKSRNLDILGSKVPDLKGKRAYQGTPEYLLEIILQMQKKAETREIADDMLEALKPGKLEYSFFNQTFDPVSGDLVETPRFANFDKAEIDKFFQQYSIYLQ